MRKKKMDKSPAKTLFWFLTGHLQYRENSNSIQQSICLSGTDYEQCCSGGVDSCYDSARQSNFFSSCFLMKFTARSWYTESMWEWRGGITFPHLCVTRNQNALHFCDDKQKYKSIVSRESLNKLKVLNGKARFWYALAAFSWVFFLWFFPAFLRLPISKLSPLLAVVWL